MALEVIPEPDLIAPTACGPDTPVIYVGERQVSDPAYLDALSDFLYWRAAGRETADERGGIWDACPQDCRGNGRAGGERCHDEPREEDRAFGLSAEDAAAQLMVDLLDAEDALVEELAWRCAPRAYAAGPCRDEPLGSWRMEADLIDRLRGAAALEREMARAREGGCAHGRSCGERRNSGRRAVCGGGAGLDPDAQPPCWRSETHVSFERMETLGH